MNILVDFLRIKYEYHLNPIHSTRKVVEFRICTMSHKLHQYFGWYMFWSFKLDEKNIHVSYEIYVNESQCLVDNDGYIRLQHIIVFVKTRCANHTSRLYNF